MKEKKHKKIEGTMITVMILLLIIGIKYAYFMISKSIDIGVVSAGTLSMKFTDGNETLELTNTPIYEEDIDTESDYITFSIENTGSINMYTNIYFKDIAMDSELKDYDFKWILEDITEEDVKIVNEIRSK